MHPGVEELQQLSESQIEQKIMRLNGMYFMTENDDVRQQMILLIDTYKIELEERRISARQKSDEAGENELDSLIKVR
jgi:hypothetical protein|tara:strand:+ start:4689 stop:4919 length:231 start_codon:yes stop_codon:yes gene_type:complete